KALIEVAAASNKSTERELVERLSTAHTASGIEQIVAYRNGFCTNDLTPRKTLLTKEIAKANPQWLERLLDEQRRICALIEREHKLRARDRSKALLIVVSAVIGLYSREKDRRGLLDYDDLIDRTLHLF